MLGYLFIVLTVICNVSKGGVSKKATAKLNSLADNIDLSFLRNMLSVIIGLVIIFASKTSFSMPANGWWICFASGISMSLNYIVWLLCLKTDAYMLATTASSSSFVIAAVSGVLIFGEKISVFKAIAFVLIVFAIYFMVCYQTKTCSRLKLHDFMILLLVFLSAGTNSLCQKLFTFYVPGYSVNLFTFYTFAFSCSMLLVVRPFFKSREKTKEHVAKLSKLLPSIVYMGIAMYGATFFLSKATQYLDAVVIYPLNSALNLVGGVVMAWICFAEKPSRDSIIGTVLSLGALILSRF